MKDAHTVYLPDAERTAKVFDEDFDLLVTPVAYDLELKLATAAGLTLEGAHGIPQRQPEAPQLKVATLFLSKQKGAIVFRMRGFAAEGAPPALAAVRYTTPEGVAHAGELEAPALGPVAAGADAYSVPAARKAVALTQFVLAAKTICELRQAGEKGRAAALAAKTLAYMVKEGEVLTDEAFQREVVFARDLAKVTREGT